MSAKAYADVLERLVEGVRNLCTSEAWTAWLSVQSKFWKYSPNNSLLIAMQRPDASVVAGYQRWHELGRWVRKGEVGIRILAPCRYRTVVQADDAGDEHAIETIRGFRVTTVFALEQTDGEPLPELPISRLTGDDPAERFGALREHAESLGYRVEVGDFDSPSKCGETNFTTKTVTLSADLAPSHMQKTMFHELAHIALHSSCIVGVRSIAELEAESVAWICCDAVGVAADAYSFAYCATWSGGGDEAIAQIRVSAQRIQHTARAILEAIGITPIGTP